MSDNEEPEIDSEDLVEEEEPQKIHKRPKVIQKDPEEDTAKTVKKVSKGGKGKGISKVEIPLEEIMKKVSQTTLKKLAKQFDTKPKREQSEKQKEAFAKMIAKNKEVKEEKLREAEKLRKMKEEIVKEEQQKKMTVMVPKRVYTKKAKEAKQEDSDVGSETTDADDPRSILKKITKVKKNIEAIKEAGVAVAKEAPKEIPQSLYQSKISKMFPGLTKK